MFRIGEFSKIAQVPGSVLRYYDQIGLFKPVHTDQWTGYRLYSASQLPRLHRILALKELGLTLDQIARLVDEEISTAEIRGMLTLRKAQVEQLVHEEMARLRQIEAHLHVIEAPDPPNFDIVLKDVPAQHYLSAREVLPKVDAALDIMRELVRVLPTRLGGSVLGHFTTGVHSETLESDRLDIELGAILFSPEVSTVTLPGERLLKVTSLPAVDRMATAVQVGGFENNCRSYGAIGMWVEANGYAIAGPGREVLIKPPRLDQLDEMVTEIQFPVEPHRDHTTPI
jgi:DNA-binding transcriptional MerR regulator/effector-binding domain-containing protein